MEVSSGRDEKPDEPETAGRRTWQGRFSRDVIALRTGPPAYLNYVSSPPLVSLPSLYSRAPHLLAHQPGACLTTKLADAKRCPHFSRKHDCGEFFSLPNAEYMERTLKSDGSKWVCISPPSVFFQDAIKSTDVPNSGTPGPQICITICQSETLPQTCLTKDAKESSPCSICQASGF